MVFAAVFRILEASLLFRRRFSYLAKVVFALPLEGVYECLGEAVGDDNVQLTVVDEHAVAAVQQLLQHQQHQQQQQQQQQQQHTTTTRTTHNTQHTTSIYKKTPITEKQQQQQIRSIPESMVSLTASRRSADVSPPAARHPRKTRFPRAAPAA